MRPAQKSETRLAGRATQETNQKTDTPIIGDTEANRQRFATLQAKFAQRGLGLQQLSNGSYALFRANTVAGFRTLGDAEAFLHRLGGAT